MSVTWVKRESAQRVQWLGRVPNTLGVSAGVEASGLIPTLFLVGLLGLAIYGGVKAVGSLKTGRLQENKAVNKSWLDKIFGCECWVVVDKYGRELKTFPKSQDDESWDWMNLSPQARKLGAWERRERRGPGCCR